MKTHWLEPKEGALHGHYDPGRVPALVVESGDRIVAKTLDVAWGIGQHDRERGTRPKFEPRPQGHEDGPALLGPIAVEGAAPGQILAIHWEEIRPVSWGWTFAAGKGPFWEGYLQAIGIDNDPALLLWDLDPDTALGRSERGVPVALRPFLGMIGLCPAEPALRKGWLVGRTGGNLDWNGVLAGSTLFLPIETPQALLSIGDGHALQGCGEIAGSAIECPMERVSFRLSLLDQLSIAVPFHGVQATLRGEQMRGPWLETPQGWSCFGYGDHLHQASHVAIAGIVDLLQAAFSLRRSEALALASPLVDLRIVQIVNGVVAVEAYLPRR